MCDTNPKQQTKQEPLKSAWLITNKTNLHVGDEGATSFGIIDKSIQRDAVTTIPCINSSSLKGAINEYCCNGTEAVNGAARKEIFGSDKAPSETVKEYTKGKTIFFDAQLLFLPCQDDTTLYKLAYCEEHLNSFVQKATALGLSITVEQLTSRYDNLKKCDNIEGFKKLCDEMNLPIIARNVLKNGESENLWYEQYIPSEAVFGTLLISNNATAGMVLETALTDPNSLVQIGANATIGYGYCKFTKLIKKEENNAK